MPNIEDIMKRGAGPSIRQLQDPAFTCAQRHEWEIFVRAMGWDMASLMTEALARAADPTFVPLHVRIAEMREQYGSDAAMPIVSHQAPKLAERLGPDLALLRFDAKGRMIRPERPATRCRAGCVCAPHDAPIEGEEASDV